MSITAEMVREMVSRDPRTRSELHRLDDEGFYTAYQTETGQPDLFIKTFMGKSVHLIHPDPEQICIEDIAHSLAHQCRYLGHCRLYMSVAEHSLILARYAETTLEKSPQECLEALMHDAVEAYTGDFPRPFKALIPQIKAVEDRIDAVVRRRFGLAVSKPDWVDYIDKSIVANEKAQNMHPRWKEDSEGLPITIECFSCIDAEDWFLEEFFRFGGVR